MKIAIAQIEKYKKTLELLKTTLDKGKSVNLTEFGKRNHLSAVFFTVLKGSKLIAKTNTSKREPIYTWNSTVTPNNRMAVAVIEEIRNLQKTQRNRRKGQEKFLRPVLKDEVRVKRAYNRKLKAEVETTEDFRLIAGLIESPEQEAVEDFYYDPIVEVNPESIVDHLPIENAPTVVLDTLPKSEKRTYTKAVKKIEELESTSKIYFLGMKIITIKKTVKNL